MIDGLDPGNMLDQLRIVVMDVLHQLGLGVGRTGDEDFACVGDGGGNLVEEILILGGMAAADRVRLVMDVAGRVVRVQHETVDIVGLDANLRPRARLTVRAGGVEFPVLVRIDTPEELSYYAHGGILPYVLRQLLRDR